MAKGERVKGWRCAVCTYCGRCFDEDGNLLPKGSEPSGNVKWTGTRCEECVGCGKCMEAWGLCGGEDGESGPTDWAGAFRAMDDGNRGAPPPVSAAPGQS